METSFSPLHEGDTSVAQYCIGMDIAVLSRFSPLHEGDTSVAVVTVIRHGSVVSTFQSPSRGGHLRGALARW